MASLLSSTDPLSSPVEPSGAGPVSPRRFKPSLLMWVVVVVAAGIVGPWFLPTVFLRGAYTLSLLLKEILLGILPFVIFSCVTYAFSSISNAFFVVVLLGAVCVSNVVSTVLAYSVALYAIPGSSSSTGWEALAEAGTMAEEGTPVALLEPLWVPPALQWVEPSKALFLGVIVGLVTGAWRHPWCVDHVQWFYKKNMDVLKRVFIPAVPVFIFGFVVKLVSDGKLGAIVEAHWRTFFVMVGALWGYLLFLACLAAGGSWRRFKGYVNTIGVPAVTAFTTMSSAAALPLSIEVATKNVQNRPFASAVMPATVNIHLIGDSLCVPILAMMLMQWFQGSLPGWDNYLVFVGYFVLAKFSIAAVPGGGIIVMVPVLSSIWGFTPEMNALITTIYILLDPLLTSGNVIGNHLFCVLFHRVLMRTSYGRRLFGTVGASLKDKVLNI